MSNTIESVGYTPHQHADRYIVLVDNPTEYAKWKGTAQQPGDKSIALVRFVGKFEIYKSATSGNTGPLLPISTQELETEFFSNDKKVKDKSVEAAIQIILEHGDAQPYNMKTSGQELNASRGQGEVKQGHNTGR